MQGQLDTGAAPPVRQPLEGRLAHLDCLCAVFTRLAATYPGNLRIADQLGVVTAAADGVRALRDRADQTDVSLELARIREGLVAAGARDVDLDDWGLGES